MIAHEPESVFYCGRGNLRCGGAVPPSADLYGLARHDRRLVDTDVGELDRSRRRWGPRFSRVETRSAQTVVGEDMKSALLVTLVAGLLFSGVASVRAEVADSARAVVALTRPREPSTAWRRSMAKAMLTYCNDVSQRLPRNTPKESEWVQGELNAPPDQNRLLRVTESVEFARYTLVEAFKDCVEYTRKLASGSATSPVAEAALWARLARAFNDDAGIQRAAVKAGVVSESDVTVAFLGGLRLTILESAVLPLLESR
jgi:hypothetical protein